MFSKLTIGCSLRLPINEHIQLRLMFDFPLNSEFQRFWNGVHFHYGVAPSLELRTTLNLTHGRHLPLASKIGWRYCPLLTSNVTQNEDWQLSKFMRRILKAEFFVILTRFRSFFSLNKVCVEKLFKIMRKLPWIHTQNIDPKNDFWKLNSKRISHIKRL